VTNLRPSAKLGSELLPGKGTSMWGGMDPRLWKELQSHREMSKLSEQTPTKEWPLIFLDEFDALLIVREWKDGNITAYTAVKDSNKPRDLP
jgi:hypothetical protein